MKNVMLVVILWCFINVGNAQKADAAVEQKVEQEVLAAFKRLTQAAQSLDSEAYFQHFDATAFVGLNSDGTTWQSLDDLKTLVKPGFNALESVDALNFTKVKVSVLDQETALLVNEYEQSMTTKNGAKISHAGGGLQVWSKRSGQWQLVAVSASDKAAFSQSQQ